MPSKNKKSKVSQPSPQPANSYFHYMIAKNANLPMPNGYTFEDGVKGLIVVEHINGDTLDCRRENLRWVVRTPENSHLPTWADGRR